MEIVNLRCPKCDIRFRYFHGLPTNEVKCWNCGGELKEEPYDNSIIINAVKAVEKVYTKLLFELPTYHLNIAYPNDINENRRN